jgi:hypothetical protein
MTLTKAITNQRLLCPHSVWQNRTVQEPPRLGIVDRLVTDVPKVHCPASLTKRSYNNNPEADEYRKIAAPSRLRVFWMASHVIEVEVYRLMAHAGASWNAENAANIPIASSGNRASFLAFRIRGMSAPSARDSAILGKSRGPCSSISETLASPNAPGNRGVKTIACSYKRCREKQHF